MTSSARYHAKCLTDLRTMHPLANVLLIKKHQKATHTQQLTRLEVIEGISYEGLHGMGAPQLLICTRLLT